MPILVLNCGSSSIKFSVIDPDSAAPLISGSASGIGETSGSFSCQFSQEPVRDIHEREESLPGHGDALDLILAHIEARAINAIGHRVVHGGAHFSAPCLIDAQVLDTLAALDKLAPLHNPINRQGIEKSMALFPGLPQVAVFDTAFHTTIPAPAHRYAVPEDLYARLGVRRYGFHGISHQYISGAAAEFLDTQQAALNLISLHLGNGASAAAVAGGKCIDTSMGMTPLEGLAMGTRSGDLDPGALLYLLRQDMDVEQLDDLLNEHSGLRGLCGDNDMRRVVERARRGDENARLALDIFCYRARKYIGAYCAALGRVDALVFTAGIGENNPEVRERIADGLQCLGMELDIGLNRAVGQGPREIHAAGSPVAILVIPTNEELQIARQVQATLATD